MYQNLTKEEKAIRDLAELKNPYNKICPNRHLWNEGFIVGCKYERQKTAFWEKLKILIKKNLKTNQ